MAEVRIGRGRVSRKLRSYAALARTSLLRGRRGRVLLAAFVGTHVPLISLAVYFALGSPGGADSVLVILGVALVATLLGTAAMLYALNALLTPVSLACQALRDYVENGVKPEFPVDLEGWTDTMMSDVEYTVDQVERMNQVIHTLEELSARDHLTGVYNRRGCEENLEKDLARVRRGGDILTLVVLDVDCFKRINDDYGHQAGDACLKHAANVIQSNIRRGDWLARWGGDEFVLALWDAEPGSSAGIVLDRVVEGLQRSPARSEEGLEIPLSLSGGVYRCTGEEDAQRCFALADDALRRAKREGRNRMIHEA